MNVNDLSELSDDLFNVVTEPYNSQEKLIELQRKYRILSEDFYDMHLQGCSFDEIEQIDFHLWIHYFEIFIETKGNLWELKRDYEIMEFYFEQLLEGGEE